MPYYRRFRRTRGYRRFYRRRGYRRSYRRFRSRRPAVVSSRSRLRVKIPVIQNIQITIPGRSLYSYMASIFPWVNTGNRNANSADSIQATGTQMSLGAVQNPIYQSYADLFDEVKYDGCTVTMTCTDPIVPGGSYTGLLLGTAVDRSVTSTEPTPNVEVAKNSASWYSKVAVNNSIPRLRRSIWASDTQERTNFVDSDYTLDAATGNTYLNAYSTANGNMPFFKPVIRFGLQTTSATAADRTANFLAQVNFYFTFRNPKGAAANAGARSQLAAQMRGEALPPEAVSAVIDDDELAAAQQEAIDPSTIG